MPRTAKPKNPPAKAHARGWGDGTVTEVRPGVYRAWRARATDATGRSRRPSRTFRGEGAAQRAALWATGAVEPAVVHLGHVLDRWLALRTPVVRASSARNYRVLVAMCAPLAHRPVAEIEPDEWQQLVNDLNARYARSTLMAWRAIVGSALKAAVPRYLPTNPLSGVVMPGPVEQPPKAWRRDEVRKLLDAAQGRAHELWLWLSLGTGIRLGESRALLWTDVDLQDRTVTISKSLDHVTDQVGPTKSGRTRAIALPDELVPVLVAHRARQRPGERWVCVSSYGGTVPQPGTIHMWLKRLAAAAGVSDYSPHATRHTFATLALDEGVPLKAVSEALGHADVAITARVYSHAVEKLSRRPAAAIGAVLAGRGPAAIRPDLHANGSRARG